MAKFKAKGTISWFNFQESKVRFNANTQVEKKNIFLNTDASKSWFAISLDDSTQFEVCPIIKNALWSIAQNGSCVVIYIEAGSIQGDCREKKAPCSDKKVKKYENCPLHKNNENSIEDNSTWVITNIELVNKNEDEK